MQQVLVTLPHGFNEYGSWVRVAKIRELNGYDEQYLAEVWNYPLPFKVTFLLERVVKFSSNGSSSIVIDKEETEEKEKGDEYEKKIKDRTRKTIRYLTVGDRVALMLHLRKLMFGDKMECITKCSTCKKTMSLDLSISNLLQPAKYHPQSEYLINTGSFALTMRPLAGIDQEALFEGPSNFYFVDSDNYDFYVHSSCINRAVGNADSSESHNHYQTRVERLVRSCIISSNPPLPNDKLSEDFLAVLGSQLEELDPQADIVLELCCPECHASFQTFFNTEEYIFQEIYTRSKEIEQEVHWIAFNYHWNEHSILSLPLRKRKRYIDLINSTLSGDSI